VFGVGVLLVRARTLKEGKATKLAGIGMNAAGFGAVAVVLSVSRGESLKTSRERPAAIRPFLPFSSIEIIRN
jgi:hypothetical protein